MAQKIRITKSATVPSEVKLERYRRSPDLGPRVLFFSGGTALRALSQEIIEYTHNSIHIMTPFDSGGSSAKIRAAFRMLAVGDIRNRLMALADRSLKGNPEIFELFATRLPKEAPEAELCARLTAMIRGKDRLMAAVPDPMRKIIRNHLQFFLDKMPADFDLRGASIGNLILTGGFFNQQRHIDPVIYLFTRLVEARGTVRPVVNRDAHLAARLADGSVLVGQHLITGKESEPIASPVADVWITNDPADPKPMELPIRAKISKLITSAELICYPMGSFYSSIIANLLPQGVGESVSRADCPKIYVPNTGRDPEMKGLTVAGAVSELFRRLDAGCDAPAPRDRLLNFVLVDSRNGDYNGPIEVQKIRRFGVEVIDAELITPQSAPYLDHTLVLRHLLSLT
ncbi:protein of unknown function UPF0052 and CofD [Desulfovibrio sp. X2]|uniref:GAK system CofD-like protein n=1 Tax=Desulfovibrio sp. X2 TaxID=941449 RepID=UPI000358B160|nr:GAK system CofD-like protein [Desulfovibrio sp. X2]EPR41945.1 protein of unknown function UPF0052 and CofD [Desulfovibrio sp. X2]